MEDNEDRGNGETLGTEIPRALSDYEQTVVRLAKEINERGMTFPVSYGNPGPSNSLQPSTNSQSFDEVPNVRASPGNGGIEEHLPHQIRDREAPVHVPGQVTDMPDSLDDNDIRLNGALNWSFKRCHRCHQDKERCEGASIRFSCRRCESYGYVCRTNREGQRPRFQVSRIACDRCFFFKQSCERVSAISSCQRCTRLNCVCLTASSEPPSNPPSEPGLFDLPGTSTIQLGGSGQDNKGKGKA